MGWKEWNMQAMNHTSPVTIRWWDKVSLAVQKPRHTFHGW